MDTETKEIHTAITRKVKPGCEEAFEKAIIEFFSHSLSQPGILGAQLLRPLPGSQSRTYGILRSFAREQDRDAFYQSDSFIQWQKAVESLVEGNYLRRDLHGLEAFFTDPNLLRQPPRWKMAIATWLGVWPTVYVVSSLVDPQLSGWPPFLAIGVANLFVVSALTWLVMPGLTRLMRPWLVRLADTAQ